MVIKITRVIDLNLILHLKVVALFVYCEFNFKSPETVFFNLCIFAQCQKEKKQDKPNTIKLTKTRLTGFSRYIFPLLEFIEIHFHTLFEMKFQFASMKGKG